MAQHLTLPDERLSPPSVSGRPRWRRALWIAGLLALLLLGMWLWMRESERRAVRTMDPAQRTVLFRETLDSFQSLCLPRPRAGFERRCRQQAGFLEFFPECDAACRERLEPALRRSIR